MSAIRDPRWEDGAACRGLGETMFPDPSDDLGNEAAKAVCAGCDVRAHCLRVAMERREPHGVWGGRTADERDTARRAARYRARKLAVQ